VAIFSMKRRSILRCRYGGIDQMKQIAKLANRRNLNAPTTI